MRTLSVLGSSSNAGKSWLATALCAWLRRQGVNVAPFKAQNMANNAFATLEGGEIGVAQAIQAQACGLRPTVEMNPILLKPNGPDGSQIVRLGVAGENRTARSYYEAIEEHWDIVRQTLDFWKDECDVLVMEGAGSPVELNLMHRDIVNLRPIEYTEGRWLLVSNIEYGGVFAQVLGTWGLLPEGMKSRGLGAIVNRFRGDLSLFAGAKDEFAKHTSLPYLGALPQEDRWRIDDEDSLNAEPRAPQRDVPYVAWIKYPQISNTTDQRPWQEDEGIETVWTTDPDVVRDAVAVVLPGSKNTFADLVWLKESGLATVVSQVAAAGRSIVGICGGMQMLGKTLADDHDKRMAGLGLLPLDTWFRDSKRVVRNQARLAGDQWETYEIHCGESQLEDGSPFAPILECRKPGEEGFQPDGIRIGKIWGTYQHGLFDSAETRKLLVAEAGVSGVKLKQEQENWNARQRKVYDTMADALDQYLDLDTVRAYLEL